MHFVLAGHWPSETTWEAQDAGDIPPRAAFSGAPVASRPPSSKGIRLVVH